MAVAVCVCVCVCVCVERGERGAVYIFSDCSALQNLRAIKLTAFCTWTGWCGVRLRSPIPGPDIWEDAADGHVSGHRHQLAGLQGGAEAGGQECWPSVSSSPAVPCRPAPSAQLTCIVTAFDTQHNSDCMLQQRDKCTSKGLSKTGASAARQCGSAYDFVM